MTDRGLIHRRGPTGTEPTPTPTAATHPTHPYFSSHLDIADALCRLRYAGSASRWGFAIYRASHDDYQDNFLPNGYTAGTPEDALDCAAGLYLTGWVANRRINEPDH